MVTDKQIILLREKLRNVYDQTITEHKKVMEEYQEMMANIDDVLAAIGGHNAQD